MRCREVRCWLYSFRPTASWPVDVVTHLQQCLPCQQLRIRLARIEDGMTKLTGGPSDGVAKERLLERIAATPQTAMPQPATAQPSWPWLRWGAYLTSAAALLAFGFWLGHERAREPAPPVEVVKTVEVVREKMVPVEVIREKLVPVASNVDRELFATLLKRNARLVQTSDSEDRLGVLFDIAADCRQHALALIERGPRDTLPLTVDLYLQVLREGIAVQLANAPAPARAALQETARDRLDKLQLPADEPISLPRVVADQRSAMAMATRRMRELIDTPEQMVAQKPMRASAPMAPTAALVQFAVVYSAESDPLVKADICSDCVRRLMPSMTVALSEMSEAEQLPMGQQFGEIIKHGIYAPLAAANTKEPPPEMQVEAKRIIQITFDAVAGMEKNLQKGNEKAAPGLQRAIEASRKVGEKGRGNEKSKGKGKGKAKGHSSNVPTHRTDFAYLTARGAGGSPAHPHLECSVQARPPAPRAIADYRSRFRERHA